MKKIIPFLFLLLPLSVQAQTCEELCQSTCAIGTQEQCNACIETCEDRPRRVAPIGPSKQHGVDYLLHRTIGLTALSYMDKDFPGWLKTVEAIRGLGFHSSQLGWIKNPAWCVGHWEPPFPSNEWVTDDVDCDFGWMLQHGGSTQLFLMVEHPSQAYFLIHRWYELAWWRDLTIVITRWEQDNYLAEEEISYEEYMLRYERLKEEESLIQKGVEDARTNMMLRYPYANINVLNAMTVNRFPGVNVKPWAEGWPTVTDMIWEMVEDPDLYEPDTIAISYWKRGVDPTIALDYVKETTKYPSNRMFITEFGGAAEEQVQRYSDYIPLFWDWGIHTILIWVYEDNWEDRYGVTAEGLAVLQDLNIQAIDWNNRGTTIH